MVKKWVYRFWCNRCGNLSKGTTKFTQTCNKCRKIGQKTITKKNKAIGIFKRDNPQYKYSSVKYEDLTKLEKEVIKEITNGRTNKTNRRSRKR